MKANPAHYPLMVPHNMHAQLVESGEWMLYKASLVVEDTRSFDVHQWWDSMKERLPTMYPYVLQTLCMPHTSCNVGHSFSMWKNVCSEKQCSMQHGLHNVYVSFGFNGVVNAL